MLDGSPEKSANASASGLILCPINGRTDVPSINLTRDRCAALLIAIPALLSIVIVQHHPVLHTAHTGQAADIVDGIGRMSTLNATVHAAILLTMAVQTIGLTAFAERLGLRRLTVRAGLLFYGAATVLLVIPATFDGFVTPLLPQRCSAVPDICFTTLTGSLMLESAIIQAFTKVALASQAIGWSCWSARLATERGWVRWLGLAGIIVAAIPLGLIVFASTAIDPWRLTEILLGEIGWPLGAAALLWGSVLPDRSALA
jgi:hypothetical protein